jgi:hypothetical protein
MADSQDINMDSDASESEQRIKDMSMDDLSKALRQYKKAGRDRREVLGGLSKFLKTVPF